MDAEKIRLSGITFKAGAKPRGAGLEIECSDVTVLVGPNNSGKSRTLIEIDALCSGTDLNELSLIQNVKLDRPTTADAILDSIKIFERAASPGEAASPNHIFLFRPAIRAGESELNFQIDRNSFKIWLSNLNPDTDKQIRRHSTSLFTARLDGRTRFQLVDPKPTGDLELTPRNHLWQLFIDDKKRELIREFSFEAFGKYFVIDPTGMSNFKIRLSDRPPEDAVEEQALDRRSREFHSSATLITEMGDGVQTSIGLLSAVVSLPAKILLVDEPEAFLHPTLARRLGKFLCNITRMEKTSLVVSTHSSEFLLGCVQSAPDLRIVRLSYDRGTATARSIEPERVRALMLDALLRSAHAMRAMFHRGVIVCEADADRAFYEEVNSRLNAIGEGVEDTLFMNAQNWQTVLRIASPLRDVGVPAVALFDFDVLMDRNFSPIWNLIDAPQVELSSMQNSRARLKTSMESVGRDICKTAGLSGLPSHDREHARQLLEKFAGYGVLFVPVGELERWMPELIEENVPKSSWLIKVFTAMGSDPADASYLRAGNGGVWEFLRRAKSWIDDPNRLGIRS